MTSNQTEGFDAEAFLVSAGIARRIVTYRAGDVIMAQGDPCDHVFYLQQGRVKLSVLSAAGREAIVAMVGPGTFFGEGCLTGQVVRIGSATATTESTALLVEKGQMVRLLHTQHALSDRFIAHLLARNIRIEEDLLDQMFNSSEQRLARALVLLAGYGRQGEQVSDQPSRALPSITQATLADMVGTTRARVNFFMRKFERLGLIDATDGVKVNRALLTAVRHD